MNKQLTNLIKSSNLVIITGSIGSGKSLLLTKLAHSSPWKGTILTGNHSWTDLPTTGNIFIDDLYKQDNYLEEIEKLLTIAKINQQKIFFAVPRLFHSRFSQLSITLRDSIDLIIQTQGVKTYWWTGNKCLPLTIKRWERVNSDPYFAEIPLTKEDFTRLDKYQQTLVTNPLWLNNQENFQEKLLRETTKNYK